MSEYLQMNYRASDFEVAGAQALQRYVLAEMTRRMRLTECRIALFMLSSRLPISEITLVLYKGKEFPQWKGAVALLPVAPNLPQD